MTARTLSDASGAPAAINAFLRGAERRAAVFAELQCGDAAAGDAALAVAMRAFNAGAARATPISDWPRRFWSLLLATPMLRRLAPLPARADALAPLVAMGHGPRAALLLRLAAGLDEQDAAAALGIAPATYRLALQRALPHRADGSADPDAWQALAQATQLAVKSLPPGRLAHLARLRETALQPVSKADARAVSVPPAPRAAAPRRSWLPAVLWSGLGACVVVLAVTFLWPVAPPQKASDAPSIRVVSLPHAEAPAATFDAQVAMWSDRDFDLLLDPRDEAVYRDLEFYAWFDAQQAAQASGSSSAPADPATVPSDNDGNETSETSDATL